jgi:hypothetical protein
MIPRLASMAVARAVSAAMLLMAGAKAATAQLPVSYRVATGIAAPVGDLAAIVRPGQELAAMIGIGTVHRSRFLVEATYRSFSGRSGLPGLRVQALTGNVLVALTGGGKVQPYAVGGAGVYHSRFSGPGSQAENDLGASAGLGMSIGRHRIRAFTEIRFENIFSGANDNDDSRRLVPVTAGLAFRP